MKAFGPVPSRRLGHSLGINNIPPKICTYTCIYCQLGRTIKIKIERSPFYDPKELVGEIKDKVKKVKESGESIDYLTFVPDGEPTLDSNLGYEIELLKPLSIKIAVITNSSLIWRPDVREELMKADWVSLKIDSVEEETWRKIDRPHRTLHLDKILDGIIKFSKNYKGDLVTETMLIKGINDSDKHAKKIADFLSQIKPSKAYLSIPTRPPAEKWVQPPTEEVINEIYQIFNDKISGAEYLIGYEGNAFAFTGNIEDDILSITSVHPMREEAVKEFLEKANSNWLIIQKLIEQGKLIETKYKEKKFYIRRLRESRQIQ